METLYFILGALSVVTSIAILRVFMIKKELKEFTNDRLKRAELYFDESTDMLDRRIDQEIDRVDRIESKLFEHIDKLDSDRYKKLEEIYTYIDSRTDKLENRIETKFKDNTSFVDNIFHELNSLKSRFVSEKETV
jgi:biopolymer transport protein ExbB/TolQ